MNDNQIISPGMLAVHKETRVVIAVYNIVRTKRMEYVCGLFVARRGKKWAKEQKLFSRSELEPLAAHSSTLFAEAHPDDSHLWRAARWAEALAKQFKAMEAAQAGVFEALLDRAKADLGSKEN